MRVHAWPRIVLAGRAYSGRSSSLILNIQEGFFGYGNQFRH